VQALEVQLELVGGSAPAAALVDPPLPVECTAGALLPPMTVRVRAENDSMLPAAAVALRFEVHPSAPRAARSSATLRPVPATAAAADATLGHLSAVQAR
jgi:hypothetical protein